MKKIASLSLEKFSKFCEIFPRDADENANWKSYFDLNNNNQWDAGEPLYDDVGTDGIGPFDANYSGPDNDGTEANGKPDQGEPNFGILDKDYVEVISRLSREGVKINVTLIFTVVQALMMCKAGAYIISPFVGRLDDIDETGVELLYSIRHMLTTYQFKTLLLAASLRHVRHVHEAIAAEADIATVPAELFDKLLEHPLTEIGIKKFDDDWKKLGIRQFP